MYEIYITNIHTAVYDDKLPDVTNAVQVSKDSDLLIHSDILPSQDCKISEGSLTLSDNAAGSLEITLPPCNVGYNKITPLMSEVKVVRDGIVIWYGRLLTVDEDFWKQKKCVFEGELSYLLDSLQTPQTYIMNDKDIDPSAFLRRWISNVLAKHNGAVEPYKRFKLGETPSSADVAEILSGTEQLSVSTNFENTLDVLKSNLLDIGLDVHVNIYHNASGERVIDFKSGYTQHNASMQSIKFGENLLDYASNADGSIYYTAIYPRGKSLERQIDEKNAEYLPSIDDVVYEDTKYYERVLDYANPDADNSNNVKDTYRYKTVSTKEDDNPSAKGWFIRYDFFRSSDREVVKSDLKTYFTRSQTKTYDYAPVKLVPKEKSNNNLVDINPSRKEWYERKLDHSIAKLLSPVDIMMGKGSYMFYRTTDEEFEYGKTYYTFVSEAKKKEFKNFIGDLSTKEIFDPKSKYLCKEYLNSLARSSDGINVDIKNGRLVKNGTQKHIYPGDYLKVKYDEDKDEYYFYYMGHEESDYINREVFMPVVPKFYESVKMNDGSTTIVEINPSKKGWYYSDYNEANYGSSSYTVDGKIDPEVLKGSIKKCNDKKVLNGRAYCYKLNETVVIFTKVDKNKYKTTDSPYKLKWYELLTDTNKKECVSLVGTQSGMYYGSKLYVDGQTGRMYNLDGLKKFGYIYNVMDFDTADKPSILLNKSIAYFQKFNYSQMSFEVTALDLHYLNPNVNSLELHDNIYCESVPHGLNTDPNNVIYFPVTEITIDLLNPENTKYTLNGNSAKNTITKSISSSNKNFNKYIEDTQIVSESTILESAKEHADNLIKKSVNGSYASFIYTYDPDLMYTKDAKGNKVLTNYGKAASNHPAVPVSSDDPSLGNRALGIRVANGSTDGKSTGKWEWFVGGLGYYHRDSIKSKWSLPKVAITMDGHIVCDMIDTGTLRLSGAGSKHSSKAHLEVYNSNGSKIGSWDQKGISILNGSIKLGKYDTKKKDSKGNTIYDWSFKVTDDGTLTVRKGVFLGGTISGTAITNGDFKGKIEASGIFNGTVLVGKNDSNIKKYSKYPKQYPKESFYNCRIEKDGTLKIGWNPKLKTKKDGTYVGGWNFQIKNNGEGRFSGTVEAKSGFFKGSLRLGTNDFTGKKKATNKGVSTSLDDDDDWVVGIDEDEDEIEQDNELEKEILNGMALANKKNKKSHAQWKKEIKSNPNNAQNYKIYANKDYLCIGPPQYQGDKWKFKVKSNGVMTARKGTFTGTIKGSVVKGSTIKGGSITQDEKYKAVTVDKKGKKKTVTKTKKVEIANGIIKTQDSWIKLCKEIGTDKKEDEQHFALGWDTCAFHNESDGIHWEVSPKWIIKAAMECRERNK